MALLPEPQRRGEIKFWFAKFLPYNLRLALIVTFLVAGVGVQFLVGPWYGVAFLLAATLLALVKGYDNKLRSAPRNKEWTRVTRQQFERVLELNQKAKSWDQTFIDITCVRGFLALAVILGLAAYVYYFILIPSGMVTLADMWAMDIVVLVVPHWLVGTRSILKNAPLVIKIENLLRVADIFEQLRKEGEELQYMLEIGETKEGKVPLDAKMVLIFHNGPPEFLGLQLQLAINNVQGTDYPYFYCVLVARPEFGLLEKSKSHSEPPPNLTISKEREGDVHIIVIRQTTTKTSGYYTKPAHVKNIFLYALAQARAVLGK